MKEPCSETVSVIIPDGNRWNPAGQCEISLIRGLSMKVWAACKETARDGAQSGERVITVTTVGLREWQGTGNMCSWVVKTMAGGSVGRVFSTEQMEECAPLHPQTWQQPLNETCILVPVLSHVSRVTILQFNLQFQKEKAHVKLYPGLSYAIFYDFSHIISHYFHLKILSSEYLTLFHMINWDPPR